MKRILAATTAGFVAASVLVSPVLAQVDIGISGDTGAKVGAGGVGVNVGAGADVDASGGASTGAGTNAGVSTGVEATAGTTAQAGVDQVVSLIEASQATAADLAAANDISTVTVVSIDAIANGENSDTVEAALTANEDGAAALRNSIASNTALASALASEGIDLSTVVAASANADSSITVYTR